MRRPRTRPAPLATIRYQLAALVIASFCLTAADTKDTQELVWVNASGPEGSSINEDIVDAGVAFPRLHDAGDVLVPGDYMWNSDCSDYYLQFPLAPDQFPFVCVELAGRSLQLRFDLP